MYKGKHVGNTFRIAVFVFVLFSSDCESKPYKSIYQLFYMTGIVVELHGFKNNVVAFCVLQAIELIPLR